MRRESAWKAGFILLLCLGLLLLGGCHGTREENVFKTPSSFDTGKGMEITFWAKNDTNKNQVRVYESAIEDFERHYPNVTVKLKLYTDYGKIYNDVITNISTGTTPNVCITYPDHVATYLAGSNVVVPLDDLMEDERYGLGGSEVSSLVPHREDLIEDFVREGRIGGELFCMPFMRSTEACYINLDYLKALGFELPQVLTWDFVWEVARAATRKNEDGTYALNGSNVMIPFIDKSTDNLCIQYLRQKGAGYCSEEGEIQIFNEDTRELLKTVAANAKLGAFSTFKISSYPANFLNAGQCVIAIDSTAGSTWMGSEAPLLDISEDKLVHFETAVRPVPQVDPDHPLMISQGPSVSIFNKSDPQEVLASWLFVQYLLTDKVQIAYAQTEGYVPVTTQARENPKYQEYLARAGEDGENYYEVKIQATKMFLDNLDHTFTAPVFQGSASLRDAAGALIENVVKGVRRKKTVDDVFLDQLFEEMKSLYRLDQIQGGGLGEDLGPLPLGSKILLGSLGAAWLGMGLLALRRAFKQKGRR